MAESPPEAANERIPGGEGIGERGVFAIHQMEEEEVWRLWFPRGQATQRAGREEVQRKDRGVSPPHIDQTVVVHLM